MDSDLTYGAPVAFIHEGAIKFGVLLETTCKTTIKGKEESARISFFSPEYRIAEVEAEKIELIDVSYSTKKTAAESAADRLIRGNIDELIDAVFAESGQRKEEARVLNEPPVEVRRPEPEVVIASHAEVAVPSDELKKDIPF